ncbi:serine hydrolase [Aquimarina sp. MMG016]|uniref:serine hydrolase n=1 Tax=Aquimarina sp. MMG016 TaxID=2822690 RepID=UPI001B3A675F|nr:serine hydrolase [Aquimarina sp. MMG016]MBQ4822763.1 serine hydrolase [Aquimarina sp. MMG016]
MRYHFSLLTIIVLLFSCSKRSPLETVLASDTEHIKKVMSAPEGYEVQILYSQINRDKKGALSFVDYEFNVNDSIYFYPASTVKFPVALIALEKLKELQEKGVDINRGSIFKTELDTLYTSIEKENLKIFAVSSNKAYNRLFELLGQDYINQKLISKNLKGRISHRLSAHYSHNPKTQSITFFKENTHDSSTVYTQESIENSPQSRLLLHKILKGKGFIYNDSLMQKPKDFSEKNYLPLTSLHETMKRIQFPELYQEKERFHITSADRASVLVAMKTLPSVAGYDKKTYYDSYGKFFIYGDTKKDIPEYMNIYNKVGYAYGYLTDCAYIQDTKNQIEFILSATIHVNKNGTYNDDHYEYDDIGIPFLAELGRQIYELEKKRKKSK